MKKHSLESLRGLPIWSYLHTASNKEELLLHQGVAGLYEITFESNDQRQFKEQKRRNLHFHKYARDFLDSLGELKDQTCLLKGMSLIDDLYPSWGARFMSDVDIFCPDMSAMEEAALAFGMKPSCENSRSWLGNEHKREYLLETDLGEIPFEFHSKFFWHRDNPKSINFKSYKSGPGLALEECLVFLIGHYAFQHTCQKLYWLIDIYLFILEFNDEIDFERFYLLIEFFQFERALSYTNSMLKENCGLMWNQVGCETSFPLRKGYEWEDSQRHWYYLALKYYLKNGFRTNLSYGLAWLRKK